MRVYDAAFYIAAFFIIGVAAASLGINIWLSLAIITILVSSILKHRIDPACRQAGLWYAIIFLSFFLGYFYLNFYSNINKEQIVFGKDIVFEGVIIREPVYGLKAQRITLKLHEPYRGEVEAYISIYPEYHYGDLLEVKGKIVKSSSGRSNISSFPKVKFIADNYGNSAKAFLFSIKRVLVRNIELVLPQEKAAFMSGILFGERGEFKEEFKEALQKSGTTHLVALSGYNVSIIAVTLSNVLLYFVNRRKAFWASLIFVIAFVLMTGAEESVVRAAIMGVIFLISREASRLYSFRNAITLTAAAMLVFNPKLLVFNVGFQLSFMALLGLVYLRPIVEKLLKVKVRKSFLNWKENLIQTSCAQIATLPIIVSAFGYFSYWSIAANVLILAFMPLTMFLGFVTAFSGIVSYEVSLLSGWIAGILLGYEIFIINFFGVYLS